MYRGVIVEEGPATEVLHGPSHPYTAVLMEAASRTVGSAATALSEPLPEPLPAASRRSGQPGGCRFAERCALRIDGLCAEVRPPERIVGPGHLVQCHLEVEALPVWRTEAAAAADKP